MTITDDLSMMDKNEYPKTEAEELLQNAINAYDNGNLKLFKVKAVDLYNVYCSPGKLQSEDKHLYSLGIIYSRLAQFYTQDKYFYPTIIDNAIYCLSKAIVKGDDIVKKQCAAMRILLLLDDNWNLMLQMVNKFINANVEKLYNCPDVAFSIMYKRLDPLTYEKDVLRQLGYFCIYNSKLDNIHSFISQQEMQHFNSLCKDERFGYPEWPLTNLRGKYLFKLFYEYVEQVVNAPSIMRTAILI